MLAHHPRPDVRGTIAKDNASASFVLSQEMDGVTIGEDQIGKVQDNDAPRRLVVDELAQLIHMVGAKLTADREHNGSVAGAMNFEHRPGRSERNCRAMLNDLERAGVRRTW